MNRTIGPEGVGLFSIFAIFFVLASIIYTEHTESMAYIKQGCTKSPAYGTSRFVWKCPERLEPVISWGEKNAQ